MASNGKLPSSDLVVLSTPGKLVRSAASSYESLRRAAGVVGTTFANHAYRNLAEQERLFELNYQKSYCEYSPGKVDKRGPWEGVYWYRKPGAPATAVPGTSNHGWGKAVDWQGLGGYGSTSWERFADQAAAHEWSNSEGKANGEPWHWVYMGEGTGMSEGEYEKIEKALYQTSNGGVGDNVAMFGTPGGTLASLRYLLDDVADLKALLKDLQQHQTELANQHGAILEAIADLATGESGPAVITQADVDAIALATTQLVLSNIKLSGSLVLTQAPQPPAWAVRRHGQ